MGKMEALAHLRTFEPRLRAFGADAAYLFGSTSRDNARPESDIDVLLDIRAGAPFTLLDLAATRRILSDGLAAPVDVTTLADLSPRLGQAILSEAIQIF